MIQPTETPSRVSIIVMAGATVAAFVAACWVNLAPIEQYTVRHAVGFALGFILGMTLLGQTVNRAGRRYRLLEAARREQRDAELARKTREMNTGTWTHPETGEVMLQLFYDEGTWQASGELTWDFDLSMAGQDGWFLLPSDRYARITVTDAEGDGFKPAEDVGTAQARIRLGLGWGSDV